MIKQLSVVLLLSQLILGCETHRYSIIESEYTYDKRSSGGGRYYSKTPLLIDHKTGKTLKLSYDKDIGYHWLPVRKMQPNGVSE